ncbi:transporter substrate-binding domain-containing protein [Methylocaldum sp.]|uniref:transporter substrate-binding domain-containing protein n=1 Tax=Methylocaldum sp. TaxID=1969727 RepID=UPI002D598A5B|nr:transporter substrate-binding domain-containing protein [Methylocaldum sp.]HYE36572.1 transporter substrate-binding domain-containing protein [Methylocaldum sp.]
MFSRIWLGPWGVRVALVLALIVSGLPGSARAEPGRPLIVGAEIDFPPYVDVDAQGQPTGFAVELFAAVAAAMDIPITFHPDRWDIVWQDLKAGKLDALPLVARMDEREGQVEFTQPHTIGYDSFFVRKEHPPINSIGQARALSIIVLRSDAAHHALVGRGFTHQLVIVDSLADGFRLLASGQHDAVLAPRLQGNMLVEMAGLSEVIEAGPLLKDYRREFCFAVRKGDTELRDRLDQGLAIVKASGEYDRLYRKWLGIYETPTFPVKYAVWGAGAIAVLLALLGLWTWQLRRQVARRTAELAQAVAAVQAERQRLHDVLQGLPVYVMLLSQDYQVVFANRFFEERYGKAHSRRCYQYLFNRSEPCEVCETFKVLKTDAAVDWDWTGPDGRDYKIHDYPFADSDGSPMIMEVGIDVTEMNRAKQALREANASLERRVTERTAELEAARWEAEEARDLLRVTMDNAPALMSYIDTDCRYRRVNKAYEQWFGHSSEQVYGRHIRGVLGEAAWLTLAPYVERALAGERVAFEIPVPYAEGDTRWIHATYSPDRDAEGWVRGFVAHVLDITERKHAEEELRKADRRKDEFLAMLAHELRNPLAPISNAVQIMRRLGTLDPKLQWTRDVIDRQVEHLTRLVDDLLDVSRISRGKIELKNEPLSLADIVQRAVETSRPLIDARRHQFTAHFPPEPVRVEGDLVRLAQVVSNLLNNAAKYTDEGGQIELTVEPSDGDVVIRVRDSGRGIDPTALSDLFDLFYQVDRTIDRAEGGLGIGLSLVKRLVAMHGGEVRAFSEGRGRGSEFVIRLPRLPDHPTVHSPFCPNRSRQTADSGS